MIPFFSFWVMEENLILSVSMEYQNRSKVIEYLLEVEFNGK